MPSLFQSNWTPQVMPTTNMSLQNNFANFSLNNMGGGQQYPPQQQGMMDNSNMGMQMQGGMRMN